jgi:hypothetical protein
MKYFIISLSILLLPTIIKAQAVYFRVGSESDIQGTEVVIPVTVENFTSIISMQGTIAFNSSIIQYVST